MGKFEKASAIIFESINVNAVDTVSGIFVGRNIQLFWSSNNKSNTGLGTIKGTKNLIQCPLNIVIDPDTIDHPVIQSDMRK